MARRTPPSYRLHKPTGQAVVTLHGKDHYLGKHGTPDTAPESWEKYHRLITQWLLDKKNPPPRERASPRVTIAELTLAWWQEANRRYVKQGQLTAQIYRVKQAIRPLNTLYASLPAADFTAPNLVLVREDMMRRGWSRPFINSAVGALKTMFDWAGATGLVPGSVGHGLRCVKPLSFGTPGLEDSPPRPPVPWEHVHATLPGLSPVLRDLVFLLYLTGMRPCEACGLAPDRINQDGFLSGFGRLNGVWVYEVAPAFNKNHHKGRRRVVCLGPRAQRLLAPYLETKQPGEFLFSPADVMRERLHTYKTRKPGARYRAAALGQRVRFVCKRLGVEHWTPHQLRHTRATEILWEFGLDAARAVLGHAIPGVTGVYAAHDYPRAAAVMREIG